jgi:hypothetical protein
MENNSHQEADEKHIIFSTRIVKNMLKLSLPVLQKELYGWLKSRFPRYEFF